MTGGQSDDDDGLSGDDDAQHTAEVWLPGDQSCQLPRLPAPGWRTHTQSSYTTCGGDYTRTSCLTFDGEWEQSHSLYYFWLGHVSWQSPAGTLLMGGRTTSGTTTELLSTTTDTTIANFSLPYETR